MTHPAVTQDAEEWKRALLREVSRHVGSLERVRHWTRHFIYTPRLFNATGQTELSLGCNTGSAK